MAQTISRISKAYITDALDTYNHTTTSATTYKVRVRLTELPPSGITITIKNNGATITTSTAASSRQRAITVESVINCAAADVLSIVLDSSTPADVNLNVLKAIITITQGAN